MDIWLKDFLKLSDEEKNKLKKAQCQEWGYKNPLTRLVALFS